MYDDITNEIAEAFNTDLADAVTEFKGVRFAKGNYDPITGKSDDQIINYSGRGVFGSYAINLIDGDAILATDQKLTVLQAEVTDLPKINDSINGYKVIHIGRDPANITWIIQLRA